MGTITGYTAERMKAIEDASIVSGQVVGDNLILTRFNQTTINAGNVRGLTGPTGPIGDVSSAQLNTAVPAGSITMYPFSAVPSGWLAMEGQNVANGQTLYPALWAVAPASWKSGSTLVLPDTRGRFAAGLNTTDAPFDSLLKSGGSKNSVAVAHTHEVSTHTHALPDHTHTISTFTATAHTHSFSGSVIVTGNDTELVVRLPAPISNGWASVRYMNPWNTYATPLSAGINSNGQSSAYTGLSLGVESKSVLNVAGVTAANASPDSHTHTLGGGGSGTAQVITSQSGGTSTVSQSPSSDGVNANLPPYFTIRFIIRAY